jgi:hypothetical protein
MNFRDLKRRQLIERRRTEFRRMWLALSTFAVSAAVVLIQYGQAVR